MDRQLRYCHWQYHMVYGIRTDGQVSYIAQKSCNDIAIV